MAFVALLDLKNLNKSYGALAVTQDLSLTVEPAGSDVIGELDPSEVACDRVVDVILGTQAGRQPAVVEPICVTLNVMVSPATKSSVPSVFRTPAVSVVAPSAKRGAVV